METRRLLTVEEAADQLHMSRSSLYKLVMRRDVDSIKVGKMRRIPPAALDEFIAKERAAGAA